MAAIMTKIVFFEPNGTVREVTANPGETAMEVAVRHGVEGVDADCGGVCSCATCHGYINGAFFDRLTAMNETEDAMLELVEDQREDNSRLLCQVKIGPELDGIVIKLPGVRR
jgi:2Fe-2S ferredoxin